MYSAEDTTWHLVSETRLGRISILKNLDERTARETYKKLKPDEYPKTYIYPKENSGRCFVDMRSGFGFSRSYGPNDDWLEKVHIIGPEGVELNPWFGVEPTIVDLRSHEERNRVKTSEEI